MPCTKCLIWEDSSERECELEAGSKVETIGQTQARAVMTLEQSACMQWTKPLTLKAMVSLDHVIIPRKGGGGLWLQTCNRGYTSIANLATKHPHYHV